MNKQVAAKMAPRKFVATQTNVYLPIFGLKSQIREELGTPLFCTQEVRLPKVPAISIIDDDASVRIAVSRLVRSVGYSAHAFASADDFLNSEQLYESSCVIVDVQMPGISGIELQGLLHLRGRSVPMIFITAFPDENARAQALKAGAVAFLGKPFDATTLVGSIEGALRRTHG